MTDKIKPADNASNIRNANKGTPGTNRQYDQNQGNRGRQLEESKQKAEPPTAKKHGA